MRDDRPEGTPPSPTRSSRSSGCPRSTAAVDCVGFEAKRAWPGRRYRAAGDRARTPLMEVTRAGGAIGIPGLYVTGDPGGVDDNAKIGMLGIRIGLGWAKSHTFTTGQCPVMHYNRQLMQAILHDKVHPAKNVNVNVIKLDEAPQGLRGLRQGCREEVRHRSSRIHLEQLTRSGRNRLRHRPRRDAGGLIAGEPSRCARRGSREPTRRGRSRRWSSPPRLDGAR